MLLTGCVVDAEVFCQAIKLVFLTNKSTILFKAASAGKTTNFSKNDGEISMTTLDT